MGLATHGQKNSVTLNIANATISVLKLSSDIVSITALTSFMSLGSSMNDPLMAFRDGKLRHLVALMDPFVLQLVGDTSLG